MKKGKFNCIIGGQAGSESKGKLSAYLAELYGPDVYVMSASPNAGHTVITPDGKKKVSYHLPIGAIADSGYTDILLGPASLINPYILHGEIVALGIDPNRIVIDNRAGLITGRHLDVEDNSSLSDIGSTLQGVGAARMDKMSRGGYMEFAHWPTSNKMMERLYAMGVRSGDTAKILNSYLDHNATVLCEMTQGFDLDLEHGVDPIYCTSKMVNPAMAMAEAGVSPSLIGNVYGVIRPYPIRVSNRTGTSGPYAEAEEINWKVVMAECGYPDSLPTLKEITTTTKLPRRVFQFSWERYERFVMVCRPTSICLQFANYVYWGDYEQTDWNRISPPTKSFIRSLESRGGVPVEFVGTGPGHKHMIRLENWKIEVRTVTGVTTNPAP